MLDRSLRVLPIEKQLEILKHTRGLIGLGHCHASDDNMKYSICYPKSPGESSAKPKAMGLEKGEVGWSPFSRSARQK